MVLSGENATTKKDRWDWAKPSRPLGRAGDSEPRWSWRWAIARGRRDS